VDAHGLEDKYWRLVGNLLAQLRGLSDGYSSARSQEGEPSLSEIELLMLTMVDTDMDAVVVAAYTHGRLVNEHFKHPNKTTGVDEEDNGESTTGGGVAVSELYANPYRSRRHHGHCSALIQLAPNLADLWVTHATWDSYRAMLRMVKYLDMPLPGVAARRMVFTANPSNLYSADDFYELDTGLTVLETSITNYNSSLWAEIKPQTLMTWVRAMVANRLARTGEEWTEIQDRHKSGTCNNQWMVVD
ncbi:unnamed protein product, partial [Polarella glacialis]